jgi:hypothetical protein
MRKIYPLSLFRRFLLFPLTKEKGLGLNGLDSNPQTKKPPNVEERQGLVQLTINGDFQEG